MENIFPEMGEGPSGPPREVVYEAAASDHLDARREAYPRLDEVMRYVEWQLARWPDNDYAVQMPPPHGDTWLFKIGSYPTLDIPAVRVLYRFTAETLTIWNVRVSEE